MKSKLFAIGGGSETCEVYDGRCKKFVAMKPPTFFNFSFENGSSAVSIGGRIVIFREASRLIAFYDVNEDQWSEELYDSDEHYDLASCVKLP